MSVCGCFGCRTLLARVSLRDIIMYGSFVVVGCCLLLSGVFFLPDDLKSF